MPYFIFEGPDGTGKSTAIQAVHALLEKDAPDKNVYTQLPGATPLGKWIRTLVKTPHQIDSEIKVSPYVRQMLYATDYADYLDSFLRPKLASMTVLCDRCSAISAIAYGMSEGADTAQLKALFENLDSPPADIIFIFHCPVEQTISRMASERDPNDHFDNKPLDFKRKIHAAYEDISSNSEPYFQKLGKKIIKIDSAQSPESIANQIYSEISTVI